MIYSGSGHCPIEHLLDRISSIQGLIRPIVVVAASEPSQPAASAGWTAPPEGVKAVNPHGDSSEPLFDVVPVAILELTARFSSREGSQIAASINEKRCVVEFVFLL